VRISVPTRICDLGGWTDTWFAVHGVVCHLAVWPGIDVELTQATGEPGVTVHVGAFARDWHWRPGTPPAHYPDPLLAATLDEAQPPSNVPVVLQVTAGVPAGASMGTSAATCVAVLSTFDAMAGRSRPVAEQVARAHRVETERLGWQSGVQDQWAAAPGAVHLIDVRNYPHATCRTVPLTDQTATALNDTLLVIWLGRGHSSTAVHEQVVAALRDAGPADDRLETLRRLARDGAAALERGDLDAYGACLSRNTEAQRRLHPALVSDLAQRVIDLAADAGARGWKINGAGGDGGTVSVLCADRGQRDRLAAVVPLTLPPTRVLPVTLHGAPR
jgi:D-glycero-alpha-D-manno-heptose-7-phosphate kinase